MTDNRLELISRQITGTSSTPGGKNLDKPPLHLWHPELSGEIDIVIKRDGRWIHEGGEIKRAALVRLFASILRREDDGQYYLVTPVEKWRLRAVEALPLLVTDFEYSDEAEPVLTVTLNTGRRYEVDQQHPLFSPQLDGMEDIPAVQLDHGLAAMFSRAAWYRLVENCEQSAEGIGVRSRGLFFNLGQAG